MSITPLRVWPPPSARVRLARWQARLRTRGPLDQEEFNARMDALTEARDDLVERVSDMRATTLAGLRAKARAPLACARADHDGEHYWTRDDDIMGWSLARDLVGDELADLDPRRAAELRREAEGSDEEEA